MTEPLHSTDILQGALKFRVLSIIFLSVSCVLKIVELDQAIRVPDNSRQEIFIFIPSMPKKGNALSFSEIGDQKGVSNLQEATVLLFFHSKIMVLVHRTSASQPSAIWVIPSYDLRKIIETHAEVDLKTEFLLSSDPYLERELL